MMSQPPATKDWRKKIGQLLWGDLDWRPVLEPGEHILAEAAAGDFRGLFGGNSGVLVLTNRHLTWRESRRPWPFRRSTFNLALTDVEGVGKTTMFSYIAGGHRLQLRLRSGKIHRLWVDGLDRWIEAIEAAKADVART